MKRAFVPYEWPAALYPLRDWLRRNGVDVDALKSERQVLWMAKQLGAQKIAMPRRGKPTFPAMLKIQRSLCPNKQGGNAPVRREQFIPGTFGAASAVRHIDPAEYLRERAKSVGVPA